MTTLYQFKGNNHLFLLCTTLIQCNICYGYNLPIEHGGEKEELYVSTEWPPYMNYNVLIIHHTSISFDRHQEEVPLSLWGCKSSQARGDRCKS
jgi:hypothetical protein